MAEELRWALIVISVFVIGGLLIHGLWSVRKRTARYALVNRLNRTKQPARFKSLQLQNRKNVMSQSLVI